MKHVLSRQFPSGLSQRSDRRSGRKDPFSGLLLFSLLPILLLSLYALDLSAEDETGDEILDPVVTHTVRMSTTHGVIEMELYGEDAPRTVKNFAALCDTGFYNGILFHRVHPGFLIQAGCPKTRDPLKRKEWGSGGESVYGGPFADELDPLTPSFKRGYRRGVVAMANSGPNTNRSQFFILLGDVHDWMPPDYTIFGYIPDMTTVDSIASVELVDLCDLGGTPASPVRILSTLVFTAGE